MSEESALEVQLARALGHRLQNLRVERGISQEALANAVGLSRNHYQLLEAGLSDRREARPANPRLATLRRIARQYGMRTSELVAVLLGEAHPTDAVETNVLAQMSGQPEAHRGSPSSVAEPPARAGRTS